MTHGASHLTCDDTLLNIVLFYPQLTASHRRPIPDDKYIHGIPAASLSPPYLVLGSPMDSYCDAKCHVRFEILEERVRHVWSPDEHIICDVCLSSKSFTTTPQKFDNLKLRLEHYLTAHFACKICSTPERIARFSTQDTLRVHMYRLHHACPCCETPKLFDDLVDLRMHIQGFHNACLICSSEHDVLTFENMAGCQAHMEDHHHVCIFSCGSPAFGNNKALRRHYVEKHFGCSFCTIRSFRDEKARKDHCDNEHHGLRGNGNSQRSRGHPQYHCKDCNEKAGFSQSEELASHIRKHHGAINCPDPNCTNPPRLSWQPGQRAHMESCHHPNPCNDFDTKAAMNLKSCGVCNFTSRLPNIVLHHYRNCHPCKECEGYIEKYFDIKGLHVHQCHGEGRYEHQPSERPHWENEKSPSKQQARPPPPPAPRNIYAILRIHPHCSGEEAKRASRQRRIDTHPDKLKREGMSRAETDAIDEVAQLVGLAADIVGDPVKKMRHDEAMRRWRVKYGK